ncbi:hypothetical protein Tco_1014624 [Tanacetum coccineum]
MAKSVLKDMGKVTVLTRFRRVPVSAAKKSSFRAAASTGAVKQVNTVTHTNRVNVSKTRTNTFHKSNSPIRRHFHKSTTPNTSISNEIANTVRVKGVNTAGQIAVSAVKGNRVSLLLRPQQGNPQQPLKNKGIFDSGCSRHMTRNKDFLSDYQDIDGGFVAFGGGTRGVKHNEKVVSTARLTLCCWANSYLINFALTVSPTIYASYIEHFWNTANLKTINSEKQIHAKVNGKAVVVSKSSVRRDLHLNDEDGTACLTVNEIFENLALMGYETASDKLTFYKDQFSTNMASAIICLAKGQKFNFSKLIFDGMLRNLDPKKFLMYLRFLQLFLNIQLLNLVIPFNDIYETPKLTKKVGDEAINEEMFDSVERVVVSGAKKPWRGAPAQARSERVLKQPIELPLLEGHTSRSGEGRMEHQFELTANVSITSHDSPLLGGYTPESDEGRLKLQELMTMCTKLSKQVESSDDDLDEEDVSKQGRKNDKTSLMLHESNFDGFDDETVDAATTGVSTASAPVTTAGVAISAAKPRTPPTTTTVFDDEDVTIAMAQTLIKMKEEKAKEKGVAFKDVEDSSRPVRSITTLQPLPSIDPKDKVKCILVEGEPVKVKKKKIKERIQKEKAAQEEVSMAAIYKEYDIIQASIDDDALFAAKLQQEDREQYTIEEREKL